ncbi:hypothetical protein VZT92_019013 [Zoarces viviparus]|uniref:Uncharacterized protein n=1 Tax=Zoarces viviparus TaxID=48416 RepID=A0AAW1EIN2_ZOAVI
MKTGGGREEDPVYLKTKKKSRGFFGKKMEDRQTELEKMKRKLHEEVKKKEKTETGFFRQMFKKTTCDGDEKVEEAGSSALSPPFTSLPSLHPYLPHPFLLSTIPPSPTPFSINLTPSLYPSFLPHPQTESMYKHF